MSPADPEADKTPLSIGGASGFWGESTPAVPQLLEAGVDVLVFDYLAEITMSIMARARAADPERGYALDFVSAVLKPNLKAIADSGVKVIANAGGVNPQSCGRAIQALIDAAGLDLKVGLVLGDDLSGRAAEFAGESEMFSGDPFPRPESIASVNAYLGAFPVAAALDAGADIVITGRTVDSALTLGACIHHFGWDAAELDKLAGGSLAGHILECSTQATGGNYTDWEEVADELADIGCPVAEVSADGSFVVTKPEGSGGLVGVGTVAEQMLYEIGDPQAYELPDVSCDFSEVQIKQQTADRVQVSGARGSSPPRDYKVSATFADGFRGGQLLFFYGERAGDRARAYADAVLSRAGRRLEQLGLGPLTETCVETFGDESHYGEAARYVRSREVTLKIAARHPRKEGVGVFLGETFGLALSAPPGLSAFQGGRPRPSPVVRLFSFRVARGDVPVEVLVNNQPVDWTMPQPPSGVSLERPREPEAAHTDAMAEVRLDRIALARSGDKGNKANVGIIARDPVYLPWIWQALTTEVVADRFAHFLEGEVERFLMPGVHAINFLLHDVLGGGGIASLRNDPQGKGYSQILLDIKVPIPADLAEELDNKEAS
ncbi:MAG: DUF1446 domain-containing protein [Xanthomonadales bacterium]|nr:DUF1446 domain-containing protein [Xanthomonadales bacterium]